jgi:hypothetical protein
MHLLIYTSCLCITHHPMNVQHTFYYRVQSHRLTKSQSTEGCCGQARSWRVMYVEGRPTIFRFSYSSSQIKRHRVSRKPNGENIALIRSITTPLGPCPSNWSALKFRRSILAVSTPPRFTTRLKLLLDFEYEPVSVVEVQNVPSGSQSKTRLSTPKRRGWSLINLPRCADLKLTVSFAFDTFNAKLEVLVIVPDPVTRSRIVTISRGTRSIRICSARL